MNSGLEIRLYSINDRDECLQILEGNTPEFFTPKDRTELLNFLDNLPGPYFVVKDRSAIVACGGWAMQDEEVAALTWGMVRRDRHGQGIGRDFLRYRLGAVRNEGRANVVRLRTIPIVQGFFAKEAFNIVNVLADGYGPGLDCVTMDLHLDVNP